MNGYAKLRWRGERPVGGTELKVDDRRIALSAGDCCAPRRWSIVRGYRLVVLVCFCMLLQVRTVPALEPAEKFLSELVSAGYVDMALAYLERIETSSAVSDEFRETIGYRQGKVLVQEAIQQRILSRKDQFLDRAQAKFTEFVAQHPNHSLRLSAQSELGTIQLERARLLAQRAEGESVDRQRQNQLWRKARRLFGQAGKAFSENRAAVRKRLEEMPSQLSPKTDSDLIVERRRLRAEYVQASVVLAMVPYEQAQCHEPGSSDARKLLKEAEARFAELAEKYRRRLGGLSAMLFQGRARQQLGDIRGALAIFEDLLAILKDGDAAVRPLRTRALRGAMECWLSDEIKQYEAARQRAEQWLEEQRPTERADEDWLAVQILLAKTYLKMVAADQADGDAYQYKRAARRLAIEVAKYRSESRDEAEALLANLEVKSDSSRDEIDETEAATMPEVESFDEAMMVARDLLSKRQTLAQAIDRNRPAQVDSASSGPTDDFEAPTRQLATVEGTAIKVLERALDLADEETPVDRLNQARYFLSTLHYYRGDHFRAAVIADFMSRRFPGSEAGRRSAAIVLASLVQLHASGTSEDGTVAPWADSLYSRLRETALRIAQQWEGQPEADDALATLVSLAVQKGELQEARSALARMVDQSPQRAQAQITVGQSLWQQATQLRTTSADTDRVTELRQEAITLLERGIQNAASLPVSIARINATLLVAQHYMNNGQAKKAIQLLEDPQTGPRTLADEQHPLLQQAELRQRTYLVSMLAYVSALPEVAETKPLVQKALATLKTMTQGQPGADRQLTSTYVLLARNLQQQVRSAPPEKRPALVKAFQQFLHRASESASELSVLNWIADAYLNLAKSSRDVPSGPILQKAVEVYQRILRGVDAGQFSMTKEDRLVTKSRLASVYRQQQKFAAAMDQFASILEAQPNQVYVQFEAARTLQAWGESGHENALREAIFGARPDPQTGKNLVWGYGRIAQLVAGKKGFETMFMDARYGVAECRLALAKQQSGGGRDETLARAERDIATTARLYPKLGGSEMKTKFNELLKSIQTAQGKQTTGLE